jgi:hypothetical protein
MVKRGPHEAASNITVAGFLTRLHTAVPPKRETRSAITSLQFLKPGQELMEEVGPNLETKPGRSRLILLASVRRLTA